MDPLKKSRIGRTELQVTALGLGCSGLARSESVEQALTTFKTAIQQGINYARAGFFHRPTPADQRLGLITRQGSGNRIRVKKGLLREVGRSIFFDLFLIKLPTDPGAGRYINPPVLEL